MFERVREIAQRFKAWWDSLDEEAQEADENEGRFLTFFRPRESGGLPRSVQQAVAVGAVAAILGFGGMALLSLSGLLFSLFVIYLLLTEVLGLDFEVDPRFWQAW